MVSAIYIDTRIADHSGDIDTYNFVDNKILIDRKQNGKKFFV